MLSEQLEKKEDLHSSGLVGTAIRAYVDPASQPISDEQITEYLPLVSKIAQRIISYLPSPLTFEDLVSAGTLGLVNAAHNYNPAQNAEFKTYAFIRIRGAILDELKKWTFVPSETSQKIARVFNVARQIMETTGSAPSNEQLAESLETSVEEIQTLQQKSRAQQFLSLNAENDQSAGFINVLSANVQVPGKRVETEELIEKLAEAIQSLSEKKRQTILLYYHQELTMKEIAEVLEITESRVSQIHAAALFDLSLKLKEFNDAGDG